MTGFTRYILRQLLTGALLVSVALGCIVWLTQSLQYLQFVVTKGFALTAWLKLTLYLIPGFLAVAIPLAFFFVTLFVYNKLTLDRELVVAQAAGISRLQLTTPALLAAFVGTLVCYLLTLSIVPATQGAFRELRWSIRNDVSRIVLREGAFTQVAPGLTVYVRGRAAAGELEGIMVHDTRDPSHPVTLLAERGTVLDTGGAAPKVVLLNGTRQDFDRADNSMSTVDFESNTFEFGTTADANATRKADFRERPLDELLRLTPEDGLTPRAVGQMRAEAHQRLAGPLNAIGFTVLALVFLLRGGFDRRGQMPRVVAAVAALVGVEAAWLGSIDLVTHAPVLAPLLYVVGLLPTAVGLYMIASPVRWVGTVEPAAST